MSIPIPPDPFTLADAPGFPQIRRGDYPSGMKHLNQLASAAISLLVIAILILLVLRLT